MKNLKPLALIGISLLVASSVFSIALLMPVKVSAATIHSANYVWLGGYLNTTLTLVNISDPENPSLFSKTSSNQSLDYWEDTETWMFTDDSPYNVTCPKAEYQPSASALYSKDLSEDFGIGVWYLIRLQWRPGEGNGYGQYSQTENTLDVDYHTFNNATGKWAVTPTEVVEVTDDGSWIGDGTKDGAGSMWARQMLFINVTMFLGGKPGEELLSLPLVQVPMDSWLTTGSCYRNVTYPGHPLDGVEVGGEGIPWDSEFKSTALIGAGAELNYPGEFIDPLSGIHTPLNVSYIYCHKHLIGRSDILLQGDATMDGYANVLDLGRMSDWWLWDATSKEYGIMIGQLEEMGEWDEVYKRSKEINSLDFNGDEFVNVVDLGILSDHWLESGWSPPSHM